MVKNRAFVCLIFVLCLLFHSVFGLHSIALKFYEFTDLNWITRSFFRRRLHSPLDSKRLLSLFMFFFFVSSLACKWKSKNLTSNRHLIQEFEYRNICITHDWPTIRLKQLIYVMHITRKKLNDPINNTIWIWSKNEMKDREREEMTYDDPFINNWENDV